MIQPTRGVRLNNPGNIDRNQTKWQGMAADQPDERFIKFQAPAWGIRAMAVTLITYQDKHRIRTIRGVISRWAPPVENDTGSYVSHVADLVGVHPDEQLDLHSWAVLRPLVVAIIAHENANWAYPADVVDEGLKLAGVVPPKRSAAACPTMQTAAAGGAAATTGIGTVVYQVATTPELREAATATGVWWIPLVLSMVAAGALGFIAFRAWSKNRKATA